MEGDSGNKVMPERKETGETLVHPRVGSDCLADELLQVMKDFCSVETALHDDHKHNQAAGAFMERNMQRSQ